MVPLVLEQLKDGAKTGSIDLSKSSDRLRAIRSEGIIQKIKNGLKLNKRVSSRKICKTI